jgi:sigma-B regulation protein RsbU (phosphoserine phosphatase)
MRGVVRILIAEDDKDSQNLLRRILERAGYEVIAADDGLMAWEIYQKEEIHLVITDWIMPRMGGLELCERIREEEQKEDSGYVFIILVTAKTSKADLVTAMDAGADDYITKPYHKEELLARLRSGVRIVTLEQELIHKNRELLNANMRMEKELEAANRLQRGFLPKAPLRRPGLEISWFFQPCETVGGDSCNFFALDDENVALYVLDVSGHGVPAAMLSVTLSRILTPYPERGGILTSRSVHSGMAEPLPPREVARILNERFPMDDDTGQYFTLIYGVLHVPTLRLNIVQAGHPYLLHVLGNGETRFLGKRGYAIGMFDDADFDDEAISLSPGDLFFLYSDGVTDAVNEKGEAYEPDRLAASIVKRRYQSIGEITNDVLKDILSFSKNERLRDDMTLVGLRILGSHLDSGVTS